MASLIFKSSKNSSKYELLPDYDCEELEMVSPLLPQYEQLVERPVRPGETLLTIAINYRISISELKRINRLQKDSDFYALSAIKIPVKANSVLSEILQEEAANYETIGDPSIQNGGATGISQTLESFPRRARLSSCTTNEMEDSDPDSCVGYVSIHQILREKSTRKEAKRFLQNMQADLARIKEKVVSDKSSLSDAAAALTEPRFVPLDLQQQSKGDWGLSWWRLFLAALVLLLLLPLLYLLYKFHFKEH